MRAWRRLHDDEDGQALLYGAGVVVITMALFYGAIDAGLLVLGKIQAQGAADAAALSASALKVGIHNTRSLGYRATTGQIALTRISLVRATGMALNGMVKPQPAGGGAEFREAISRAKFHMKNVQALRKGMVGFNQWIIENDAAAGAVKKAAEVAYLGNIGVLGTMDASNLRLIRSDEALVEFSKSSPMIGGTTFTEEVVGNGAGGKSHVRVSPKVNALGGGFLGYGTSAGLEAASTAGPVDATKIYGKGLAALDPVRGYGINWYTVRILAIGGKGKAE